MAPLGGSATIPDGCVFLATCNLLPAACSKCGLSAAPAAASATPHVLRSATQHSTAQRARRAGSRACLLSLLARMLQPVAAGCNQALCRPMLRRACVRACACPCVCAVGLRNGVRVGGYAGGECGGRGPACNAIDVRAREGYEVLDTWAHGARNAPRCLPRRQGRRGGPASRMGPKQQRQAFTSVAGAIARQTWGYGW